MEAEVFIKYKYPGIYKLLKQKDINIVICQLRILCPMTYKHSVNVAILVYEMLPYTEIKEKLYDDILTGCLLHDIGKIKIPSYILSKPSHLNAAEFEVIKTHSVLSYNIVKNDFNKVVQDICLNHHEKTNGTGYPNQITNIEAYCRLVTVADIYEALISDRVYKKRMNKYSALKELHLDASRNRIDDKYINIIEDLNKEKKIQLA